MRILIVAVLLLSGFAYADEIKDKDAIRAIIGEASDQGYTGMLYVAVGIRNRGTLKGVYGLKAKHVDKEPDWVWDLAKKAWKESEYNRVHSGDMWENIIAFDKAVSAMGEFSFAYTGHRLASALIPGLLENL